MGSANNTDWKDDGADSTWALESEGLRGGSSVCLSSGRDSSCSWADGGVEVYHCGGPDSAQLDSGGRVGG